MSCNQRTWLILYTLLCIGCAATGPNLKLPPTQATNRSVDTAISAFCSRCGTKAPDDDDAKFCTGCGKKLSKIEPGSRGPSSGARNTSTQTRPREKQPKAQPSPSSAADAVNVERQDYLKRRVGNLEIEVALGIEPTEDGIGSFHASIAHLMGTLNAKSMKAKVKKLSTILESQRLKMTRQQKEQLGVELRVGFEGIVRAASHADTSTQSQTPDTDFAFAMIRLRNLSDKPMRGLRASIEIPGYCATAAVKTVTIPAGGQEIIHLTPTFSDKLYRTSTRTRANIAIRIRGPTDTTIFETTKPVMIESKNTVQWTIKVPFDLACIMMPAFVTTNDKNDRLEALLSRAKEHMFNRSLAGYQDMAAQAARGQKSRLLTHNEITSLQFGALYEAARRLGVSYVNTPITFASGHTQRVKYPAEVIAARSGNCIDLSIMFAAALEKLGMRPVIILVPGHAFIGVWSWKLASAGNQILVCDTAGIGRISFGDGSAHALKLYNYYIARGLCSQCGKVYLKTKHESCPACKRSLIPALLHIDVSAMRELGFSPSPHQ